MRYYLVPIIIALGLLATPAMSAECTTTVAYLMDTVKNDNPTFFKLKMGAHRKFVTYVNKNHMDRGKEPVDADQTLFALFTEGNMPRVGIALAKDGCVIPGTSAVVDPSLFVKILIFAGLSADDMEKIPGGTGI